MNRFTKTLSLYIEAFKTPIFRKKLLFTLGILIIFRLTAHNDIFPEQHADPR